MTYHDFVGALYVVVAVLFCAGCIQSRAQDTVYGLSAPWPDWKLNGSPSPTPTPTPSPAPTPAPDAIVAPSGGDFTTIGAAYAAASCGDLIWVKEGTYTMTSVLDLDKECTSETETVIQAYPEETPTVTCSNPSDNNPYRVEHNGAWNVWDGIEIKGCYDGVKVYTGNIKIKNSEIHHNLYQGVLIATSNAQIANVLVDGNEIHHNGYDEGSGDTTCFNSAWNPTPPFDSPKHCHGVYLSNAGCDGIDGITISNNNIHHHAGRAVNINSDGCVDSFIDDTVIAGNQLVANSVNVMLWVDVRGTQITGNEFSLGGWPESDDFENAHLGFAGTSGGTITGNTFSMTIGVNDAYQFVDYGGNGAQASFDFNTWNLPASGGAWYWNSTYREDFSTQWKNVTGWDANGTIN